LLPLKRAGGVGSALGRLSSSRTAIEIALAHSCLCAAISRPNRNAWITFAILGSLACHMRMEVVVIRAPHR
jgi:hypothetical protein